MRATCRFAVLVSLLVLLQTTSQTSAQHFTHPLRLWIDQYAFASLAETQLLRDTVAGSGGKAVLAGEARSPVIQLKGYQQLHKLDVYWTGRKGCYAAFRRTLNASHAISCCPGSQAITGKADLVASMAAALGERAAFELLPPSYLLPRDYPRLARLLKASSHHTAAGCSDDVGTSTSNRSAFTSTNGSTGSSSDCPADDPLSAVWVLKEDAHRGRGLAMVPGSQLLHAALVRYPSGHPRYVLAQRFLARQHLVQGRPYYLRVWAVLMGAQVVRGFLFDGGVVVFGQDQRQLQRSSAAELDQPAAAGADSPARGVEPVRQQQQQQQQQETLSAAQAADAMVVNLWRQDRAAAQPWSWAQLRAHLADTSGSDAAGAAAWARVQAALAGAFASAVPRLRGAAAALPGYQEGSFEVLGADFLVDADLRPWLVEVNYLPSMARKVLECSAGTDGSSASVRGDNNTSSSGSHGSSSGSKGDGHNAGEAAASCQMDNPFDGEKEHFVRALLQLLLARRAALAAAPAQARAAAEHWSERRPGVELCASLTRLEQLLALKQEAAAAESLGFVPLTEQLWEALDAAGGRRAERREEEEQRRRESGSWAALLRGRRGGVAAAYEPLAPDDAQLLRWLRSGGDVDSLCDESS